MEVAQWILIIFLFWRVGRARDQARLALETLGSLREIQLRQNTGIEIEGWEDDDDGQKR